MEFETNIKFKTEIKLRKECRRINTDIKRRGVDTPWTNSRSEFFKKIGGEN